MPTLNLILGDQLNPDSLIFSEVDNNNALFAMAELAEESTHVWSSKIRTTLFLSAMRHFAEQLLALGYKLHYKRLEHSTQICSIEDWLTFLIATHTPEKIRVVLPGDYRVYQTIKNTCDAHSIPLEILKDQHFYATVNDFKQHATHRKTLRLEYWYREMRAKHNILMDGEVPVGGQWNFDQENRHRMDCDGMKNLMKPIGFAPDATTQEVIETVHAIFSEHSGTLENFDWPTTRQEALIALEDFVQHRLPYFGRYQDAMQENAPYLFHARISAALNLKLLNPREVVNAALTAYADKKVELPSVEGFIRQMIGWREFVRGYYWLNMPNLLEKNYFQATQPLPAFFWSGQTEFKCLQQAIQQTLSLGYAHHIQRLMVTGLYCQLLGVHPKLVHEWYLAVYVDAVEWVEAPNTLAMSQYADGGKMSSKPYVASGAYIQKMSNYCDSCRYNPKEKTGESACPFTNLYWDFLITHQQKLLKNPRMSLQLKHVEKLSVEEKMTIQHQAEQYRATLRC